MTYAHADISHVRVERFGEHYLTVFNDSAEARTVTVTLDRNPPSVFAKDLISGGAITWIGRITRLDLAPESVALLDLSP